MELQRKLANLQSYGFFTELFFIIVLFHLIRNIIDFLIFLLY